MSARISLLILDFDNTLFDWFHTWYHSFSPFLDELLTISGVPREVLIDEIRSVHQAHGTSEYAFLLQEVPSLSSGLGDTTLLSKYDSAIQVFRQARRAHLSTYPDVVPILQEIRNHGCKIAIFTESKGFYSSYRLRRLGLDPLVDALFSPDDHSIPDEIDLATHRTKHASEYGLKHARHVTLGETMIKPAPDVLLSIVAEFGAELAETAYVGDSLPKDIQMAQSAGVIDVFAKYGVARDNPKYRLLREVSHWTKEMVEAEKPVQNRHIIPTHELSRFSDILNLFEFGPNK